MLSHSLPYHQSRPKARYHDGGHVTVIVLSPEPPSCVIICEVFAREGGGGRAGHECVTSTVTVLPQDKSCWPEGSIRASLTARGARSHCGTSQDRKSPKNVPAAICIKCEHMDIFSALHRPTLAQLLAQKRTYLVKGFRRDAYNAYYSPRFAFPSNYMIPYWNAEHVCTVVPLLDQNEGSASMVLGSDVCNASQSFPALLAGPRVITLDFTGELLLECLEIFVLLTSDCALLASRMRVHCPLSHYFMLNFRGASPKLSDAICMMYMYPLPPNAPHPQGKLPAHLFLQVLSLTSPVPNQITFGSATGQYSALSAQLYEDLLNTLKSHGGPADHTGKSIAAQRAALTYELTQVQARDLGIAQIAEVNRESPK
ncbi:hypothetical protein FB451DRAFT_1175275 [Mycena latifolia]|nr:hypothetical protein FB451DRAFT_1175275 [Mycena latifolia]